MPKPYFPPKEQIQLMKLTQLKYRPGRITQEQISLLEEVDGIRNGRWHPW